MGQMVVSQPEFGEEDGWQVISVPIQDDHQTYTVRFWVSEGPVSLDGDPYVALSLLPAMRRDASLRIEMPVSDKLLATLPTIQNIFSNWYSDLSPVEVATMTERPTEKQSGDGVACFFSAGVDSFYSVLKHRDEITKLIYLQGFDIGLMDTELHSLIDPHIREAAAELGIPLVVVRSDFHTEFSHHFAGDDWAQWWGEYYHGAVLACAALLLGPQFKKIYIPSSHTYSELLPWGSHPLLDPLWSTEGTEIVHDGSEATRAAKVERIATCEAALRHLHICGGNKDVLYNCGRCEKCLRTMVNLHLAGALGRCQVLPNTLDPDALSRMVVTNASVRGFIEENLKLLEKRRDGDDTIIQALRTCLSRKTSDSSDDLSGRNEKETDTLIADLQQRLLDQEKESDRLRATVKAYESGKTMRLLLGLEKARQRIVRSRAG